MRREQPAPRGQARPSQGGDQRALHGAHGRARLPPPPHGHELADRHDREGGRRGVWLGTRPRRARGRPVQLRSSSSSPSATAAQSSSPSAMGIPSFGNRDEPVRAITMRRSRRWPCAETRSWHSRPPVSHLERRLQPGRLAAPTTRVDRFRAAKWISFRGSGAAAASMPSRTRRGAGRKRVREADAGGPQGSTASPVRADQPVAARALPDHGYCARGRRRVRDVMLACSALSHQTLHLNV